MTRFACHLPPLPPASLPSKPLSDSEKALKAQTALARRVADSAIKKLLEEYDLSPRADGAKPRRQLLSAAERQGLIDAGRDIIITRLFPKALAVWEAALDSGNIDVATRVIEGMAIIASISGFAKPSDLPADASSADIFERYREIVIKERVTQPATPTPEASAADADSAPRALPPAN